MENTSAKNITDFINGFGLRNPLGLVIFKAGIVVHVDGNPKTASSEVQIITSDDLMTVYLMDDAATTDLQIPEMYNAYEHECKFIPWQCLAINVNRETRHFTVAIFPKIQ